MNKNIILSAAIAAALLLFIKFRSDFLPMLYQRGVSSELKDTTFAMIKPGAVSRKNSGKIIDLIESHGFDIIGLKKLKMSKEQAKTFYAVHKDRPFYTDLVTMMTSGPIIVLALKKDNVVKAWRDLMGSTDPKKASPGTIRAQFGVDIENNAVHGSDSDANARLELKQFFPELFR